MVAPYPETAAIPLPYATPQEILWYRVDHSMDLGSFDSLPFWHNTTIYQSYTQKTFSEQHGYYDTYRGYQPGGIGEIIWLNLPVTIDDIPDHYRTYPKLDFGTETLTADNPPAPWQAMTYTGTNAAIPAYQNFHTHPAEPIYDFTAGDGEKWYHLYIESHWDVLSKQSRLFQGERNQFPLPKKYNVGIVPSMTALALLAGMFFMGGVAPARRRKS